MTRIEEPRNRCAYCGQPLARGSRTRDHVFPSCLYPRVSSPSRVQRLTVPSCAECNHMWSDDEVHFRTVVAAAGDVSPVVSELWHTRVVASFAASDGGRRRRDIAKTLEPVEIDGKPRYMIYPARDVRVLRVLRKIVRGLSFHHLGTIVPDEAVWADVLKYHVPSELRAALTVHERDSRVVRYQFVEYPASEELASGWLLTFFERTEFIAAVSRTPDAGTSAA